MNTRTVFLSLLIFFGVMPVMGANMCVKNDVVMVVLDPTVTGSRGVADRANRTWSTNFAYGTISGIAGCYNQALCNEPGCVVNDPTGITLSYVNEDYAYCYCKMTRPVVSKWVYQGYHGRYSNTGGCSWCPDHCYDIGGSASYAFAVRAGLFSSAGIPQSQ